MGEQLGLDSAIGAILIVSGCLFSNIGIEGVKAFFRRGEGGGESPRPSLSPVSHLALLRASFAAAVTSSATSVLNSMSVATKLAAIQVQDALEDVFPWLD